MSSLDRLMNSNPMATAMMHQIMSDDMQIQKENRLFLDDPSLIEKQVAHISRTVAPESALRKIPYGSDFAKTIKAIPDDDPRKEVARTTLARAPSLIEQNPHMHPQDVVARLFKYEYDKLDKNKLYEYVRDKEEGGFLGFGKTDIAKPPGYDEWKKAQPTPVTDLSPSGMIKNALIGAGFEAGMMGLAKIFGKGAAATGNPLLKLVGAGLMAIPTFAAFDVGTYPIRSSEWGKEHPLLASIPELAAGGLAASASSRLLGKVWQTVSEKTASADLAKLGDDLLNNPSADKFINIADAQAELKKYAATPRPEMWRDNDLLRVNDLIQKGATTADAMSQVSKDVVGRQVQADALLEQLKKRKDYLNYPDTIKKNIDELRSIYPEKNYTELMEMAVNSGAIKNSQIDMKLAKLGIEIGPEVPGWRKLQMAYSLPTPANKLGFLAMQEKGVGAEIAEQTRLTRNLEIEREFAQLSPTYISSLPAAQQLSMRAKLDEALKLGNISSTEHNNYQNLFRRAGSPETEQALFKTTGEAVTSREWVDNAAYHLDDAVKTGNSQKWNDIVTHFADNTPFPRKGVANDAGLQLLSMKGTEYGKGRQEFVDKLKEISEGNRDSFRSMMDNSSKEIASVTSRILYGSPESELRSAIKTDIRGGMSSTELSQKWGGRWGKYAGLTALGLVGAVAIDNLIGRSEAEAAGIPEGVTIIPRMLRAVQEKSGKSMLTTLKEMFTGGYTSPQVAEDGMAVVQPQLTFKIQPAIEDIARTAKLRLGLDSWVTPGMRGQVYFKDWANPQVQLAAGTTAAMNNADAYLSCVDNILKLVPEYKGRASEVAEAMKPLVDKYFVPLQEVSWYNAQIDAIDKAVTGRLGTMEGGAIGELSRKVKLGKLDAEDRQFIDTLMSKKSEYAGIIDSQYKDVVNNFQNEWLVNAKELAQKYSSSRIALAVEGEGMGAGDPWLRNILTKEEQFAVDKIKAINDQHAARMIQVGESPILAQEYIHHALHPNADFTAARKALNKLTADSNTGIDLAHFFSRSTWSKQLMPDIGYVMERYLPDANRRIEMAGFWKTWAPFARQLEYYGYTGPASYLNDLKKGFRNIDKYGTMNEWANRIQSFEIARLISLSPGVGLKHAFKVMANMNLFGFQNFAENFPKALGLYGKNAMYDLTGSLPKTVEDSVMRGHINTNRLYAISSDMSPYQVPTKVIDKWLETWNKNTNFIVNGVERFDRGFSFLSAASMAAKQGLTAEQASYLVYDTILKANFLSGIHNPSWLRDPKTRLLFLFQGTPFKIFEQRMFQAVRGVGAVKEGAQEALKQLQNLRNDLKEGTQTFKAGMIVDALKNSKDVAGNSYAGQLMRNIVTTGTVIWSGQHYFDANLWGHVLHVPFTKTQSHSMGLAMNPLLNAGYQTYTAKPDDMEDVGMASTFLRKWLTQGGADKTYFGPSNIIKTLRLSKNDIPEAYRDSKFRYLFSIPTVKEED